MLVRLDKWLEDKPASWRNIITSHRPAKATARCAIWAISAFLEEKYVRSSACNSCGCEKPPTDTIVCDPCWNVFVKELQACVRGLSLTDTAVLNRWLTRTEVLAPEGDAILEQAKLSQQQQRPLEPKRA